MHCTRRDGPWKKREKNWGRVSGFSLALNYNFIGIDAKKVDGGERRSFEFF